MSGQPRPGRGEGLAEPCGPAPRPLPFLRRPVSGGLRSGTDSHGAGSGPAQASGAGLGPRSLSHLQGRLPAPVPPCGAAQAPPPARRVSPPQAAFREELIPILRFFPQPEEEALLPASSRYQRQTRIHEKGNGRPTPPRTRCKTLHRTPAKRPQGRIHGSHTGTRELRQGCRAGPAPTGQRDGPN